MNHQEIQEKLFLLYDGELPAAEKEAIESHLKDCLNCKEAIQRWQQASETFLKPIQAKTSEAFVQNVMRQVRSYEPAAVRWPIFARWALPALALGMGGFLLTWSYSLQDDPVSTETLLLTDQDPIEDQISLSEVNV